MVWLGNSGISASSSSSACAMYDKALTVFLFVCLDHFSRLGLSVSYYTAPTFYPMTAEPSNDDALVSKPTSFPTFAARLWEPAGSAILLGSSDRPPALAISFDGSILVAVQGGMMQAYEWYGASTSWQPRGPPVDTSMRSMTRHPPGMAMSANGNVLAWGDPTTRSVHVLEWNADAWQERPVIAMDEDNGDNADAPVSLFYTLALSEGGDILAVGEPDAQDLAGRVRLFQWNTTNNQLWTRIRSWAGRSGSRTGYSVALSLDGGTIAIGAVENALATIVPGMVRIYRRQEDDNWSQIGQTIVGFRDKDRLGSTVALNSDGQLLAVGAPLFDSRIGSNISKQNAGQIRVFEWNAQKRLWAPLGQHLEGRVPEQGLGQVLSLSGSGDMIAGAGTMGGLEVHRLNGNRQWIPWPLSGTGAPSDLADAVLSASGRVVALADQLGGSVFVYQAVNW